MSGFEDVAGEFRFDLADRDSLIRSAAFAEINRVKRENGVLTWHQLSAGFQFQGERVPFVNPQRGIFKPRQMRHLLSIKTVFPRPGRRVWYDDQRNVHRQIFEGDETVDYAFMGDDPNAPDNRWLRDAMDLQIPVIYFLGISPGIYQPIFPAFIVAFDVKTLKAGVTFSPSETTMKAPDSAAERRYALRSVKQRLHQSAFREMVIHAYRGRCAISGLPEPRLLDAAHIMNDTHELYGQPIMNNGITLSKIHHAAFDAQLLGIDADSKVHISEKLLSLKDGPQLEALRQFHGKRLLPPRREIDSPDRDRLALRFELFRSAA